MIDFTVCFIKQGSKVLLLNREFPAWMGHWNGVGGKIEPGESPRESMVREIYEETGLTIPDVQFKGIETWFVDQQFVGGMYLYSADLPDEHIYETPVKISEGILDWKELSWITNPQNTGVASDIPMTLKHILFDEEIYEHRCSYSEGKLVKHQLIGVDKPYELPEYRKGFEEKGEVNEKHLSNQTLQG